MHESINLCKSNDMGHESLTSREAISDMTPFFSVFGESFG